MRNICSNNANALNSTFRWTQTTRSIKFNKKKKNGFRWNITRRSIIFYKDKTGTLVRAFRWTQTIRSIQFYKKKNCFRWNQTTRSIKFYIRREQNGFRRNQTIGSMRFNKYKYKNKNIIKFYHKKHRKIQGANKNVLYSLYFVVVGGERFYYPEQFDVSVDVTRASIEMSQQYYSYYMPIYMSKSLRELSLLPKNTPEYYNYALENIQPFGGLNYPEFVTPDFAQVMFDDHFNILRSPGYNPLDLHGSEMVGLLTKYRVQVDPDYQIISALLNHVPNDLLRDSDFALCALVMTAGSISDFVFEPGGNLLVWCKIGTFTSYLQKIGYNIPLAGDLNGWLIMPNCVQAADIGGLIGDTVPAAAQFAATVGDTVPAANYVPSAFVPTVDSVPPVDSLPIPTIDLDPTDTDSNNSGSPNSGFPFYSCIFGVLLVGVLVKTIFF